eukprot:scaffold69980_cov79-Cyclotella_meneghiniana.AAC.4
MVGSGTETSNCLTTEKPTPVTCRPACRVQRVYDVRGVVGRMVESLLCFVCEPGALAMGRADVVTKWTGKCIAATTQILYRAAK